MHIYTQMWTVAGVGLVSRSNTGSFKCEKWPSVSLEQLASHLALRWISVVDRFSGHSGPTVFIRRPLCFAFHSHSAQSFLQESDVWRALTWSVCRFNPFSFPPAIRSNSAPSQRHCRDATVVTSWPGVSCTVQRCMCSQILSVCSCTAYLLFPQ